jgi:hypothetical protein
VKKSRGQQLLPYRKEDYQTHWMVVIRRVDSVVIIYGVMYIVLEGKACAYECHAALRIRKSIEHYKAARNRIAQDL